MYVLYRSYLDLGLRSGANWVMFYTLWLKTNYRSPATHLSRLLYIERQDQSWDYLTIDQLPRMARIYCHRCPTLPSDLFKATCLVRFISAGHRHICVNDWHIFLHGDETDRMYKESAQNQLLKDFARSPAFPGIGPYSLDLRLDSCFQAAEQTMAISQSPAFVCFVCLPCWYRCERCCPFIYQNCTTHIYTNTCTDKHTLDQCQNGGSRHTHMHCTDPENTA